MKSQVKVVLRNPLKKQDQIDYTIDVDDHQLGADWVTALKVLLKSGNLLEKNFCFMGFPKTDRNIDYLCRTLNQHIDNINQRLTGYHIDDVFLPDNIFARDYADHGVNHLLFNRLHNHFEVLQGTVENLSPWYRQADHATKYSIRQLNIICHEMENLILALRMSKHNPYWVRPSQVTTWVNPIRYELTDEHRQGFVDNGYNRLLGGVYMHWSQIGKTLMEVFRDEGAPDLDDTVCEAITHLRYYSGEFDVEWGNDVVINGRNPWHDKEQAVFKEWLIRNGLDPQDPKLSLGHLPVGQVNLAASFGTQNYQSIWDTLSQHLDIYCIEVDGVSTQYDYCWSDADYDQQLIKKMTPGYNHSERVEKS